MLHQNQTIMSRAEQFLQLQAKVNQEIYTLGKATSASVNALETLGDDLTPEEIEEVCGRYRAEHLYQQGIRHY